MSLRNFPYRASRLARAVAAVIPVWRHHSDDMDELLEAIGSISDFASDVEDVAMDAHDAGAIAGISFVHRRRAAA